MTIDEAINELVDYVAENDKLIISFETVTMARKALEKQIEIKKVIGLFKNEMYDDEITELFLKIKELVD